MSLIVSDSGRQFWRGRRVAVSGATGFLGHHVASQLRVAGAEVVALARANSDRRRLLEIGVDCVTAALDDPAALARGLAGCDVLFHIAGTVSFRGDWAGLRRVNVTGTNNILTAAHATGLRRVIYTSSIVAVGASQRPCVLDETAPWNLGRHQVAYAATKREAEEAALAANANGMEVVAVNPGCVVGPNDHARSEFGNLCRRFWKGRVPFCFGGGNNFVDVRDVAAGHLLAAQQGRPGQRYILGGENRTYGELFTALAATAGGRFAWVRVPRLVAAGVAAVAVRLPTGHRPALTPAQVKLAGLFFYFTSDKAQRELGYASRPLADSLRDAHAYWFGAPRAA